MFYTYFASSFTNFGWVVIAKTHDRNCKQNEQKSRPAGLLAPLQIYHLTDPRMKKHTYLAPDLCVQCRFDQMDWTASPMYWMIHTQENER